MPALYCCIGCDGVTGRGCRLCTVVLGAMVSLVGDTSSVILYTADLVGECWIDVEEHQPVVTVTLSLSAHSCQSGHTPLASLALSVPGVCVDRIAWNQIIYVQCM